eukprot:scaffold672_cov126-Cylindrotheca_fusiformis.AAC.29
MSVYFKNLDVSKLKKKPSKPRTRNAPNQFPFKLYKMLQESATSGKEDVVSWALGGLAFQVHDPKRFVPEVLSKYFKQTKYKSFLRQLSFYGFKRKGTADGCYGHRYFIRGNMEMCKNIKRAAREETQKQAYPSSSSRVTGVAKQSLTAAPAAQLESSPAQENPPTGNHNIDHREGDTPTSNLAAIFDLDENDDDSIFSAFGEPICSTEGALPEERWEKADNPIAADEGERYLTQFDYDPLPFSSGSHGANK